MQAHEYSEFVVAYIERSQRGSRRGGGGGGGYKKHTVFSRTKGHRERKRYTHTYTQRERKKDGRRGKEGHEPHNLRVD